MATNNSDTSNATYIYRLTFGNTITAPDTALKKLQLEQGLQREFSDDSNSYYLTLRGIKINRKIYQPTEIEAELDVLQSTTNTAGDEETKVPSFKDISALFLNKQVKLEILKVERVIDTTRTIEYDDSFIVAENCYVYELNPQLKRDTNGLKMYVKLNIFSMDKLMTLNKYSKAYVARKLGSGILQPESLAFGKLNNGAPLIDSDVDSQKNLIYGNDKKEFIQPYLVQYNETFYDFLVRTANRCGEFLFFEDGKLTLGLPEKEAATITYFETVTLQNISPDPLVIKGYRRDSVKEDAGDLVDEENGLNHTEIAIPSSGFPDDAFANNISRNAELATDEYIFPLFKDKFTSVGREMFYRSGAKTETFTADTSLFNTIKGVKTYLSNTLDYKGGIPASLAIAVIVDHGIQAFLSNNQQATVNQMKGDLYLKDYKDKTEQSDSDKVVQFASLVAEGWTTLDYYNQIYKYEERQQRQVICIDMGTAIQDVKLGQKITIDGLDGTYVIIQIQQISEEAWSRNYEKYDTTTADKYTGKRSLKIYAIPSYHKDSEDNGGTEDKVDRFIPPVQPVSVIRRTGPQTAFVTANEDPKFQGRVRIMYPWQSEGSFLKAELQEAEQGLNAVEINLEELNKKQADLLKKEVALRDDIEILKKYALATPEERIGLMTEETTRRDKLIEDISALEAQMTEENKEEIEAKIKEKQEELAHVNKRITDLNAVATEHDKKKSSATYCIDKNNDVIKRYTKDYENTVLDYKETCADIERVQTEINEKDAERKKIVEAIKDEMMTVSTPWVRIATPMATPGGGSFYRPRVGDEVLVNFDCDNVERPYVVGSMFSKNTLTPDERYYRKQAPELQWKDVSMSISSPNGHHISFTDPEKGGGFLTNLISPGLGFYGTIFGYNDIFKSGKDLAGGIHIGDRYGIYEIEMKSHKRSIDIKSPLGTVSINAFSGITISAPNGDVNIVGKNITLEAGNKITVNSGTNLPVPDCGDAPSGKNTTGDIAKLVIEGVGAAVNEQFVSSIVDLSFVRHVIEVLVRPVDGTLLLKSRKFLKLEAGLGNATVKRNQYKEQTAGTLETEQEFYKALCNCVQNANDDINMFFDGYYAAKKNFFSCRNTYNMTMDVALKRGSKVPCISKMAITDIKNHANASYTIDNFVDLFKDKFKMKGIEVEKKEDKYKSILPAVDAYYNATCTFYQLCNGAQLSANFFDYGGKFKWLDTALTKTAMDGWVEEYFEKWHKQCDEIFEAETVKAMVEINDPLGHLYQTYFRRAFILLFLRNVYESNENKVDSKIYGNSGKYIYIGYEPKHILDPKKVPLDNDYWWKRQILVIDRWNQNSWLRAIWDSTVDKFWENVKGTFSMGKKEKERQVWNEKNLEGQILFSDKENCTLSFEGEGLHKETDANQGNMAHLKWMLRDL